MLLNVDKNHKTVKGQKEGWLTGVMYLAPHKLSGNNVCASASEGCIYACLNTAGRGKMNMIQQARINRTKFFFADRDAFMMQLTKEIDAMLRQAYRMKLKPCIRLNGTSDIMWERTTFRLPSGIVRTIPELYPDVQFYDYTKHFNRMMRWCAKELPKNYHLTFSMTEANRSECWRVLSPYEYTVNSETGRSLHNDQQQAGNVAMVFYPHVPEHYVWGARSAWDTVPVCYTVEDGDTNDLRFLNTSGVIVGLKAKGRAVKDTSGFVTNISPNVGAIKEKAA